MSTGPGSPCALVVDDEQLIRSTLCRALASIGFRVQGAGSLSDAVAALDHPIDLAVIDVHLGDGSGLEFARLLRIVSPRARIVMISADTFDFQNTSGLDIVAWLRKPFDLDELLAHASSLRAASH
jgi:DNA-binding response OmpR family regulator